LIQTILDEKTAETLERVERLLATAQGELGRDPAKAQQLLTSAHRVAKDAVQGGAQITMPASLNALKQWRPHPRGYWQT
jgi:hypothetical protein